MNQLKEQYEVSLSLAQWKIIFGMVGEAIIKAQKVAGFAAAKMEEDPILRERAVSGVAVSLMLQDVSKAIAGKMEGNAYDNLPESERERLMTELLHELGVPKLDELMAEAPKFEEKVKAMTEREGKTLQ